MIPIADDADRITRDPHVARREHKLHGLDPGARSPLTRARNPAGKLDSGDHIMRMKVIGEEGTP